MVHKQILPHFQNSVCFGLPRKILEPILLKTKDNYILLYFGVGGRPWKHYLTNNPD